LKSFWAKTHLGLLLQLYPRCVRDALEKIGEIRNLFAHSMEPITFDSEDVRKYCQLLLPYRPKMSVEAMQHIRELEFNFGRSAGLKMAWNFCDQGRN
jgi:hypothetical protein